MENPLDVGRMLFCINEAIDNHGPDSYETGTTLSFPVCRRFRGQECGEIASTTTRRLQRSLTRRRWKGVKVAVRNRARGRQNYLEVEIKDGFTPQMG